MCRAMEESARLERDAGICRHHHPATETGGYMDGGDPSPGERAEVGGAQPEVGLGKRHLQPQAV